LNNYTNKKRNRKRGNISYANKKIKTDD
jgi:hypothetical protein